jgi:ribosomal protein S18 acetylase RimI-like enzyme
MIARAIVGWGTTSAGTVRANVEPVSLDIRPAERVDDELVGAFAALIPQLSSSSPPPDAGQLEAIVASPDTVLYIARLDGQVVGSLTLVLYRIPTGTKAWIEDVVVASEARGHGVGEALNRAAIAEAAHRGAKNVSLTSRPSRDAANRLYRRLGFEPYPTNLYRYDT